jgi:hypothetical protein
VEAAGLRYSGMNMEYIPDLENSGEVKAKMLVQDHVLFKFIVTVIITINEF